MNVSATGPFQTVGSLILASNSPRRREFLHNLGLTFEVIPAVIEEQSSLTESPWEYVMRLSREKSSHIAAQRPEAWVLGADTIVVMDGVIRGKPADAREAEDIIKRLSGKRHAVITGYCICRESSATVVQDAVETEVDFADISDEVCSAYVMTGEPFDKAGGYAIQGIGGFLVEKIRGSHSNVVGLPLSEVVRDLLHLGAMRPRVLREPTT